MFGDVEATSLLGEPLCEAPLLQVVPRLIDPVLSETKLDGKDFSENGAKVVLRCLRLGGKPAENPKLKVFIVDAEGQWADLRVMF